jgi:excisionase family DNA binding protein
MTKTNPGPDRPITTTVPEVAAYLRIHPSTVYRMLKSKQLPGFRLGDWRFNVEQVGQWRRARPLAKKKPLTPLVAPGALIAPPPTSRATHKRPVGGLGPTSLKNNSRNFPSVGCFPQPLSKPYTPIMIGAAA